ncbi:ABC transporter ATP-binding protein [Saccharophagus degradans]|uniref:ABC transporter ATP-binding protein n=1 Tax=Saccharophagus degradans TaxID=86304 RepID=UPI002477F813|nr:ABC transporter ATP-binding protein [Saccharophagus degradans]WGO96527.1 ABC transporter ATP-binding protein [Saccharophagus degradans]
MPKTTAPNPTINAVQMHNVQFKYHKTAKAVLSIPNWHLQAGEKAFVQGASGAGKSTFLKLLSGLLVPTQGTISVMGQPISQLKGAKRDRFRAKHIGFIFQQFNLIPYLSVRDNIAAAYYFSNNKSSSKIDFSNRINELLTRLGLPLDIAERKTSALSIGQQQRVAIARALINNPELVIADEPTSALDSAARDSFMTLLLECVAENESTLIFVSHDKTLTRGFDKIVDLQNLNHIQKEVNHAN